MRDHPIYQLSSEIVDELAAHFPTTATYLGIAGHPRLVKEMVAAMPRGSVVVDVAIDQGGCVETSRPTTLEQPVYVEEGIIHYCVPNIPASVARIASRACPVALSRSAACDGAPAGAVRNSVCRQLHCRMVRW